MGKTLTIIFKYKNPVIKLSGLSFKAIKGTKLEQSLIRNDLREYEIDTYYSFSIDGNTAKIKKDVLISYLKELNEKIPFTRIETAGHYELTGGEIMELLTQQ